MIKPTDSPQLELNAPSWQSWGGQILVVLLSLWSAFVVLVAQGTPWFMVGSGFADDMWPWVWAVLAKHVTKTPLG